MRQDVSLTNRHVSLLLRQGACIGLFPEGTTTDGKQVGHFHSALIQPAIDAGIRLCPIALRYQNDAGEPSPHVAFIGDMTLVQSIWKILRCQHHYALLVFIPMGTTRQPAKRQETPVLEYNMLSSQSAYALLVDLNQLPK
jgi:1-acyl-sn-glycerol-3-phosphate acyltransferase